MHQDSKLQCDLCPFITKDFKRLEEHKYNIHLIHQERRYTGSEYLEAESPKKKPRGRPKKNKSKDAEEDVIEETEDPLYQERSDYAC